MDEKILFVCLGNICRSPAAEGIMKSMLNERKLSHRFTIDSAGTYAGHAGELPDSRMRAHAKKRGYTLDHIARKFKASDFDQFDYILAMDDRNYQDLLDMAPDPDSQQKVKRMTDYCTKIPIDHVPDPYYGGASGFDQVIDILEDACEGLLESILKK